jgi:hypothetical protein
MTDLKGGPQTLGLNGFLELMLSRFADNVRLLHEASMPSEGQVTELRHLEPALHNTPSLRSFLPLKVELSKLEDS